MYCVKCGRLAREGEKRCPRCGTRLVTPETLERLVQEEIRRRKAARGRKNSGLQVFVLYAKKLGSSAAEYAAALGEKCEPFIRRTSRRLRRFRRSLSGYARAAYDSVSELIEQGRNSKSRKLRKRKSRNLNSRKPAAGKRASNTARRKTAGSKKNSYAYTERNLRSVVAMTLLAASIAVLLMWGIFSEAGMRTFAGFGMGSAKGYILLGDEYMGSANYLRAVESYYTALEKNGSYEAAFRLARAYSYTGDVEKCVSALLYCTDNYPGMREPYEQLAAIYPDAASRPDVIKNALAKGSAQFGIQ